MIKFFGFFCLPFKEILDNKGLVYQIFLRELKSKFKGSFIGVFWFLLIPVFTFVAYYFVFGVVFKSKWGGNEGLQTFSMNLYSGMIVYFIFSEVVSRSSTIISDNLNFVKKVSFPLSILPYSIYLQSLVFFVLGFFVFITVGVFLNDIAYFSIINFIAFLVFFTFFLLGLSYYLSALSVYIKDIVHLVPFFSMLMLFLSPIFYSVNMVPAGFSIFLSVNPLTIFVSSFRGVFNENFSYESHILLGYFFSLVLFYTGFLFFHKVKKGFSDVL